jgi:hypothetical protein
MNYKKKYEWMMRVVWVLGAVLTVGLVAALVMSLRGGRMVGGETTNSQATERVVLLVRDGVEADTNASAIGSKSHDWNMKPQNDPSWRQQHTQQQIGYLQMENPEEGAGATDGKPVLLPLFGQSLRYKNSDRWLYTTATDQYQSIRLPVEFENRECSNDDTGCREVYTGDRVKVPSYNDKTFIVNLYKTRP